eukprot:scpid31652/ scgid28836/ 
MSRPKPSQVRSVSPLAGGLVVMQADKRSSSSLPRNARLQPGPLAKQKTAPSLCANTLQVPTGGIAGNMASDANMSSDAKRLTTRILPTDDSAMVQRKKKAQKRIDRKRKQRKRLLEKRHRSERPEPVDPPPVQFDNFTEEEIAIISNVLEREVTFAREMFAVEQGLHQEASRIRRNQSPDPQDFSEVCMACGRVRHCGLVAPLFGRKCLWVCEADQYERLRQLYSGGWYHQHDCGYDLHVTTNMLQTFTKLRHVGLSKDLEFMAQHESSVGNMKMCLLYNEDMQCLLMSVLAAGDLDIKQSSYHPHSQLHAEVYLMPHWRCDRYTRHDPIKVAQSAEFEQIFMWLNLSTEELEKSKLQITLWLRPLYSAENGFPAPGRGKRSQPLLVGLTEIPLTTVPLNDITFMLSLFPGAGKDVYVPDIAASGAQLLDGELSSSSSEEEDDSEAKDECEQKGTSWMPGALGKSKFGLFGGSGGGGGDKPEQETEKRRRHKRRSTIKVVQTEVLKGGRVTARASSLKWTLEVYQQVIRRENEEKIKEEEKKAQTKRKLELLAEQETALEERTATLLQFRKAESKTQKSSHLLKFLASTPTPSGRTTPVAKQDKEDGDEGEEEQENESTAASYQPKLLELANEWSQEIPAGKETDFKSPLHNGKDYRLQTNRNVADERDQLYAFVGRQYDTAPMQRLPSKSVQALRVQVERDRLVDLPALEDIATELENFEHMCQEEDDDDEDHSSEEETNNIEEEIITAHTTNLMQLGRGQVRKRKHLGSLPNGRMLLSFHSTDEQLTVKVVKIAEMWNFSSGDMAVRSCLLVNKQSFMSVKSAPMPGAETVDLNWTRTYQKQASNRILQLTLRQKGTKHFLRRAASVTTGQVLVDLSKLELQDGKEFIEWYPVIGLRRGKVFNRKPPPSSSSSQPQGSKDTSHMLANAGLSTFFVASAMRMGGGAGGGDAAMKSRQGGAGQGTELSSLTGQRDEVDTAASRDQQRDTAPLPQSALMAMEKHRRNTQKKEHSSQRGFLSKKKHTKKSKKGPTEEEHQTQHQPDEDQDDETET